MHGITQSRAVERVEVGLGLELLFQVGFLLNVVALKEYVNYIEMLLKLFIHVKFILVKFFTTYNLDLEFVLVVIKSNSETLFHVFNYEIQQLFLFGVPLKSDFVESEQSNNHKYGEDEGSWIIDESLPDQDHVELSVGGLDGESHIPCVLVI